MAENLVSTYDIFRFRQKENRLTAVLTLALEANKDTLLKRFLERCSMSQYLKSLDKINIDLQSREDGSTPDVTLFHCGDRILFIECKVESPIDEDQLVSHARSGQGKIPVVCISSGNIKPAEIEAATRELLKEGYYQTLIRWIGWKQIYTDLLDFPEIREKYEVAGLIRSLENENLSGAKLQAFKQDELSNISKFVKLYPNMFDNARRFVRSVVEYVQEKDPNLEIEFKTHSYVPLTDVITARLRHKNMEEYNSIICFNFGEARIRLGWDLRVKQLKYLSDTQMEKLLGRMEKGVFKLESYEGTQLQEIPNDPEIMKKLEEDRWALFSRYYYFDDERLYRAPYEIVKQLGEDLILLFNFFMELGLYTPRIVVS